MDHVVVVDKGMRRLAGDVRKKAPPRTWPVLAAKNKIANSHVPTPSLLPHPRIHDPRTQRYVSSRCLLIHPPLVMIQFFL